MTRRIFAWSLLVLAASPFTAPFSTCDLATLFSHATPITLNTTVVQAAAPQKIATTDADDVVLVNSSFIRTAGLVKLLVMARLGLQLASSSNNLNSAVTLRAIKATPQSVAPAILRL